MRAFAVLCFPLLALANSPKAVVITTKAYREQLSKEGGNAGAGGSIAGRQVFVGNLPFHTSWQDLKVRKAASDALLPTHSPPLQDAFKSCGTIVRAEILQSEGKPKGAGTVLFETVDAGELSIAASIF